MTGENLNIETEIRRFLSDEMSEDERILFEEKFVADEDVFEQVRAAEDEWIESYVRGRLPAAENRKFERVFLSTEPRRRRVTFARTMLEKLAERPAVPAKKTETAAGKPSVMDSLANFFKASKLAFGTAFALLILAFGGWFLMRNSNQIEIARQITPTPAIEPVQPSQNQNSPVNETVPVSPDVNAPEKSAGKNSSLKVNNEPSRKNQNTSAPKQNSAGIAPVLALFAGTVRAEGKMPELNLPKNASGANLQLNLESQDYKIYRVEIADPDGNLVLKNDNLKAGNSKINLFVPARKLGRGDYMIRLSALNTQNENESVADYSFRVNRK